MAPDNQIDVIINTKVTISRNLEGYRFPVKLDEAGRNEIIATVRGVLSRYEALKFDEVIPKFDDLNDELFGNRIAEREFYENKLATALFVSKDKEISVLVNGDEHIKIQCVLPGISTADCFEKANKLALFMEKNLSMAYAESLGFLTSDIERIGLALNVSYMAVIPGLIDKNGIVGLSNIFEENYCKLTPTDMKNKENPIYILESKATLGIDEITLIKIADNLALQFAAKERKARSEFVKNGEEIVDNYLNEYCCEYGIMKYGRLFTKKDVIGAVSIFYIVQSAAPMKDDLSLSWEQLCRIVTECIMSMLGLGSEEYNDLECRRNMASRVKNILECKER